MINTITGIEARRRGADQHMYAFFMKGGKQPSFAVNATANPLVQSFMFTAYLMGTPVEVMMDE